MLSRIYGFLFILILLIGFTNVVSVQAQSSSTGANLIGTIVDSEGQTVANAMVTLKDTSLNPIRTVVSDKNGNFVLMDVVVGFYEVKVSADGFQPQGTRLLLELGATKQTTFVLNTEGGQKDAKPTPLQLKDKSLAKTETSLTLANPTYFDKLPIFLRSYTEFSRLTPRTTLDRLPLPGGQIATSRISFNGQSARFNNLIVDGLDNYDRNTGPIRSAIPSGAVREFQVLANNYSAEFGRSVGGVISVITRSGTNDGFHGAVAAFLGNGTLSANDAFTLKNSFTDFEQYQGNLALSGPIKKDKMLFLVGGSRVSFNRSTVVSIDDAVVAAGQRRAYPFRKGTVPFSLGATGMFARLDTKLSAKDTLFIRYNGNFLYNGAFSPYAFFVADSASAAQRLRDNTIAVANTYVSDALNLVVESRFLYGKRRQRIAPASLDPQIVIQDIRAVDSSLPLQISDPLGVSIFGGNVLLPQPFQSEFDENSYQISNNVSLPRGRHMLKFGVNFTRIDIDAAVDLFQRGQALFLPIDFLGPTAPVISGLESFDPSLRSTQQRTFLRAYAQQLTHDMPGFPLLDLANLPLPTAFTQGFGENRVQGHLDATAAFIQDDIRIKPNLLLKAGLRYDITRLRFAPKNNGNFAPRLGLSYSPAGFAEKLSLSVSYGLFFATPVFGVSLPSRLLGENVRKLYSLPFPQAIIPFSLPSRRLPFSDTFPSNVEFIPQLSSTAVYDPNLRASYTQQANFNIDYTLDRVTKISLNYVFVRGNRLFAAREVNPVINPVQGNELASQLTGRLNLTRGNVIESQSAYDSYYHGFTVSFDRRFANRFGLFGHYTLSKAIDNFVDFTAGLRDDAQQLDPDKSNKLNEFNPFKEANTRNERGLSSQDVRSRFVMTGTLDLTSKKPIFNGIQLATIITLESGRPYNITRTLNAIASRGSLERPNFRPAGLGRNVGITPGFANVDVRFTRSFVVKKKYRILARTEVFNLFNRVNINGIIGSLIPDSQGKVALPPKSGGRFTATKAQFISAFPPRQLQFTISISF